MCVGVVYVGIWKERKNRKGYRNNFILYFGYKKLVSLKLLVVVMVVGSKDWKIRVWFKNFGRNLRWYWYCVSFIELSIILYD